MASRFGLQARVALDKQRHPERYCPERRCLWRTGGGYCPRHAEPLVPFDRVQEIAEAGSMEGARTASGARPHGARFKAKLGKPLVGPLAVHAQPWKHEPIMLIDPETGIAEPHLLAYEGGRS